MLIYAQKVCRIPDWYKQMFPDISLAHHSKKFKFQCNKFFIYLNKLKRVRQVDKGDELYNVASNIEYYQIHLAYVLFILKFFMPFCVSILY
jgi:hypothetical protein